MKQIKKFTDSRNETENPSKPIKITGLTTFLGIEAHTSCKMS